MTSRPQVPDSIQAPADQELLLQAHATGVQVYVWQAGADGKPQWVLKAPEAQLFDLKGAVIGSHYAGPRWKHNDGSEVAGKAAAKVDSPDPKAIPWLLITVIAHDGSGVFNRAATIQRIHTTGGLAPAHSGTDGAEYKSSYTADYYFYGPPAK